MSYQQIIAEGFTNLPNGLLLRYKELKFTPISLTIWLFLYQHNNNEFIVLDIDLIVEQTNLESEEVYAAINYLVNQQLIKIMTKEDSNQKIQTIVDLTPTFARLDLVAKQPKLKLTALGKLSQLFEQELGRAISPFELEELQKWVSEDQFPVELIELALKEAVLNQKKNFKYVAAIVRNWIGQGYQTSEDVQNAKAPAQKGKVLNLHIPLD